MASMPRIITVDPTWTISRIVDSAMNLMDQSIIKVDVPSASDALEELSRGCNLVVCAFELDENMKGFEFALRVKRDSPDTSVIILGDMDDPDELDEETTNESPFVYMSRPLDTQKFMRVLKAGLNSHEEMISAIREPVGGARIEAADMGPVPALDIDAAQNIVDSLLTDLGSMAIILSTRTGEVILERGAVGYIDREALTQALLPIMMTNISVKDLVGGQVNTVQFYDGEDYDIFVLSVGLHHFMSVMFDGQQGSRQFGLVNRFGRRAVEDMIALLGANAFFIQPPAQAEPKPEPRRSKPKRQTSEEEAVTLEPAHIVSDEAEPEEAEPALQLDPIEDLDADALFSMDIGDLNVADDLFDPEKLEEMAKDSSGQNKNISWDDAEKLGLLKK